jgi:hypothetical protein
VIAALETFIGSILNEERSTKPHEKLRRTDRSPNVTVTLVAIQVVVSLPPSPFGRGSVSHYLVSR